MTSPLNMRSLSFTSQMNMNGERRSFSGRSSGGRSINLITLLNAEKEASHIVMLKSFTRYKLLRLKMKLSYSAFANNKTLKEFWFEQILKSLNLFTNTNQLKEKCSITSL